MESSEFVRLPGFLADGAVVVVEGRDYDFVVPMIEHDKAVARVMNTLVKDDTELFKQYSDNEAFRKWLLETVFAVTYVPPEADAA